MKLLAEFDTIVGLTASSEASGFEVANVLDLDPSFRWEAADYATAPWVKCQISKAIEALFLSQCNFPNARFQWNATDVWTSPTIDISLDLLKDDTGNRKGFFAIAGTGPGYFRVLIPDLQALDNSEAAPAIGNLIVGTPIELPYVSRFSPDLEGEVKVTKTLYGGYSEDPRGRQRHVIGLQINDTLAAIRAIPKTWAMAVLFADLGLVSDAWLVHRPGKWGKPVEHAEEAQISIELRERV